MAVLLTQGVEIWLPTWWSRSWTLSNAWARISSDVGPRWVGGLDGSTSASTGECSAVSISGLILILSRHCQDRSDVTTTKGCKIHGINVFVFRGSSWIPHDQPHSAFFYWERCNNIIIFVLYEAQDPKPCVQGNLCLLRWSGCVLTHSQRSLSCIKGTVPYVLE